MIHRINNNTQQSKTIQEPYRAPGDADHSLPGCQHWFTPPQIAQLIGRSDQYVRNLCRTGQLQAIKCPSARRPWSRSEQSKNNYRISRSALMKFLLTQANKVADLDRDYIAERIAQCSREDLKFFSSFIAVRMKNGGEYRRAFT